jgi:hypothetical protein
LALAPVACPTVLVRAAAAARASHQCSAMPSKGPAGSSAARESIDRCTPGRGVASGLCWPGHPSQQTGRARSARRFRELPARCLVAPLTGGAWTAAVAPPMCVSTVRLQARPAVKDARAAPALLFGNRRPRGS